MDSFQVCVTVGRKGVTFLFVGVEGCQERADQGRGGGAGRVAQGPLGSSPPLITFTAAGAGPGGRARAPRRLFSHDVRSSSMPAFGVGAECAQ